MGSFHIMFINIAFYLFLSTKHVFSRTSYFKYSKNEPLKLSNHLYLTSSMCKTSVQCAVACLSLPECSLVDLDSGNLYKKDQAHSMEMKVIRNYVESQRKQFDELVPEAKNAESFLMVSNTGNSESRDVIKVSWKSNTTEKIGITEKYAVNSILYDRKSNTLFWSKLTGIYKQVIDSNSKRETFSTEHNPYYLHFYKKNLFYLVYSDKMSSINTQNHSTGKYKDQWLSLRGRVIDLTIEGDLGCWIQSDRGGSIIYVEMSTKKNIYKSTQLRYQVYGLSLLRSYDFGMLVYMTIGRRMKYCNTVKITPGGQSGKPKTVSYDMKKGKIKVIPGFLVNSPYSSNQVEVWEMSVNGSIGRKTFTTRYPASTDASTVLVDFF